MLAAWHDPPTTSIASAECATTTRPARYCEPGGYVNFMTDDGARVDDNYRGHYQRLAQIKRIYDPGNLFHLNQNIPSASFGHDLQANVPHDSDDDGSRSALSGPALGQEISIPAAHVQHRSCTPGWCPAAVRREAR